MIRAAAFTLSLALIPTALPAESIEEACKNPAFFAFEDIYKVSKLINICSEVGIEFQVNDLLDNQELNALFWAVNWGNFDTARFLIRRGANINEPLTSDKFTILHLSSSQDNPDKIQFLIDNGANVNSRSASGQTPLFPATISGATDNMRVLIENGAKVNARSEGGLTPLLSAAVSGESSDAIILLLEAGADGAAEFGDLTAFALAKEYNKALHGTDAYWALNDAQYD